MIRKLPEEAFDHYVALGDRRTYAAVAKQYAVSKRCVTKRAAKEDWTGRLEKIQSDARVAKDRQLTESLADMNERHMKMIRFMAARALEGLRNHPFDNGADAARAAELAVKMERLLAGEATKRTEHSIVEIMKHEMHTFLERVPADEDEPRVVEANALVGAGDEDDSEQDRAG